MGRLATYNWLTCVRFFSALSLVLVAFAHQPLDVNGSGIPDASAYAFPDGSIPVICVTLPAEKGDAQVAHGLPCGACLIAASIVVPTPGEIPGPSVEPGQMVAYATAGPLIVRSAFPPSAPPQAPPFA
jgi:hypothetical protein